MKKAFIDPLRSRKKNRVEKLYFTDDGIPYAKTWWGLRSKQKDN